LKLISRNIYNDDNDTIMENPNEILTTLKQKDESINNSISIEVMKKEKVYKTDESSLDNSSMI
jgi:hypothetical protein